MIVLDIKKCRELKREKGYTYDKLAELTGYHPTYIAQIFNGIAQPSRAAESKLLNALGPPSENATRTAEVNRKTRETDISLALNIDGAGEYEIKTDIPMFDHLLSQVVRHGRFDLKLTGTGDDPHHLVEDVAMCLGKAFSQALGEKQGIVRMADATVPMDDALATVAVDFSGRAYSVLDLTFKDNDMAGFATDLIRHFLETFASEARISLHARIVYGTNDHHRAEALFKALGRALDMAARPDERLKGKLPSTKGTLER
jgi:imidazoleglycerol-phosphate dehydratase